ncbi:hypothetical protein DL98DRAFT_631100 [Cadophora sp. DSE1049]|nr:hypothetical protein DL98DRAFT_631100 [Cadophora sp. DSE1049]
MLSNAQPELSEPGFKSKYTTANLPEGASQYDPALFAQLFAKLQQAAPSESPDFIAALLSAMLCAQRRGDIVPTLFQEWTSKKTDAETEKTFIVIREAIGLIYAFVGLPNCIPACLGLVGELHSRNIQIVEGRRRSDIEKKDWFESGRDTRLNIYNGVGNPEVHCMITTYFPDMAYINDVAVFGYLINGSLDIQTLENSELIVAGAITAMGATRQARSHCKASIGVGNPVALVSKVVEVASEIAAWNRSPLPGAIVVSELAEELKANLAKLHR